MKKNYTLLLLISVLCGCSYVNSKAPATPQEQLCSELKRNLIFNTASTPSGGDNASPTQNAEMMRLYEKNGCNKLEK